MREQWTAKFSKWVCCDNSWSCTPSTPIHTPQGKGLSHTPLVCTLTCHLHSFVMCRMSKWLPFTVIMRKRESSIFMHFWHVHDYSVLFSGFSNNSSSKDLTSILSKSAPASTTQSLLGNFEVSNHLKINNNFVP